MREKKAFHSGQLGLVAEEMAILKLSVLFQDCYVSQVVNNQLHDVEIRKKDETSTKGICRIQVKASTSKGIEGRQPFYAVGLHHKRYVWGEGTKGTRYEKDDVDFFLFYIFQEAKFYVFPSDAVRDKHGMKLYVGLPKPKIRIDYEKYLEAWDLIGNFLGIPIEAKTNTQSVLELDDD
jgi:hypothetical protein